MKVQELIDQLKDVRATPFHDEQVYRLLSRLDSMILTEIHDAVPVEYVVGESEECELAIQQPYEEMYIHWLCAMLDQAMMEYETANTEMNIFNGLYDEYAKCCRRKHLPCRKNGVRNYV